MKLLHIDSSILGSASVSRQISAAIVETLKGEIPGLTIVSHDLAADPIAHLSGAYLAGQSADVKHDQALQEDLELGGKALAEFLEADIVVVGVPMYNFAVPSQLKSWVDRVVVAGKTFHYTAAGAEGLVHGKRMILAVSRGGMYEGLPAKAVEHQESWLRSIFGFIGVKDIQVIRAEGIAHGPEQREIALKAALAQAATLQPA
ncbi:MAG: FMN-dependent NADH-azoreductase [Janthinobacterium lividum]